jgi:hypothetical protein
LEPTPKLINLEADPCPSGSDEDDEKDDDLRDDWLLLTTIVP